MKYKRPQLRIVGQDRNTFNLLELARNAARKAGWSEERWESIRVRAISGDYDHLLAVLLEEFDIY